MIDSFLKYLQYEKRVSANTVAAYSNDLRQFTDFLTENFPGMSVSQADHTAVRSWVIGLADAGLDARTVNRKIAALRTFFKFERREGRVVVDPMARIRALKTRKKLLSFVKETEMNNMLDNPGEPFDATLAGQRARLVLELLYATGIRLTELLQLREKDLDLRHRTIKVLGKRNKERVIPFPAPIVSIIESYLTVRNATVVRKAHGLLFVNDNGDRCYPMMIYRIVKKFLAMNTSVDKRSPHVLRHTFATHLLNKGAEINAVKDLLGHSSLAATQVYTHNSMEKLKKVFEQAHPKA